MCKTRRLRWQGKWTCSKRTWSCWGATSVIWRQTTVKRSEVWLPPWRKTLNLQRTWPTTKPKPKNGLRSRQTLLPKKPPLFKTI